MDRWTTASLPACKRLSDGSGTRYRVLRRTGCVVCTFVMSDVPIPCKFSAFLDILKSSPTDSWISLVSMIFYGTLRLLLYSSPEVKLL